MNITPPSFVRFSATPIPERKWYQVDKFTLLAQNQELIDKAEGKGDGTLSGALQIVRQGIEVSFDKLKNKQVG
jgi:hypothetical protein